MRLLRDVSTESNCKRKGILLFLLCSCVYSAFAPKFKAVLLLCNVGSHQRDLGTQIFSQGSP